MEPATRDLLVDGWRVSPHRCPRCGAKLLIAPQGQSSWQLCQGWRSQVPRQGLWGPLVGDAVPYHNWVWIAGGPVIPLGN